MQLFTLPEVAKMLGVGLGTVRDWVWKRKIPVIRIGRRFVRVAESDLTALIEGHRVPAKDLISAHYPENRS
jgi:excisionase family DNA binding protein